MRVAEVVGRAGQHCWTERTGPQGASTPVKGSRVATGQQRGRRRQSSDAGELGSSRRFWTTTPKRLLKRIGLQAEGASGNLRRVVLRGIGSLLGLSWSRRRCKRLGRRSIRRNVRLGVRVELYADNGTCEPNTLSVDGDRGNSNANDC